MGAKSKTRFVVAVGGELKELFSVRELPSGDLVILQKHEKYHSGKMPESLEEGVNSPKILEEHISVHRSEQSMVKGTTVKETRVIDGKKIITASSYIKTRRDNLLWPLYSKIFADLRDLRYNANARNRDTVIIVASDVPENDSLLMHLFVVGKSRDTIESGAYRKYEARFRFFRIVAYVGFVNVPPTNVSGIAKIVTRAPQFDRKFNETVNQHYIQKYPEGAESLEDHDAARLMYDKGQVLVSAQMEYILRIVPDEDGIHDKIKTHEWFYTREPLSTTKGLTLIGEPPQARKNPPIALSLASLLETDDPSTS